MLKICLELSEIWFPGGRFPNPKFANNLPPCQAKVNYLLIRLWKLWAKKCVAFFDTLYPTGHGYHSESNHESTQNQMFFS